MTERKKFGRMALLDSGGVVEAQILNLALVFHLIKNATNHDRGVVFSACGLGGSNEFAHRFFARSAITEHGRNQRAINHPCQSIATQYDRISHFQSAKDCLRTNTFVSSSDTVPKYVPPSRCGSVVYRSRARIKHLLSNCVVCGQLL